MPNDLHVSETGIAPPPPRAPRVLTGRAVLVMLLAFFLIITGVNAVMMVLAIRTMPGVSVKNAYEASQAFNAETARIAAQDALGLQVNVARAGIRSQGQFLLTVRDKQGVPVSGLDVRLSIGRPVDQKFDVILPLSMQKAGQYGASMPVIAAGQWDMTIELMRGTETLYRTHERVMISN
jgi:nitrogen fixation protein FixH